MKYFFFYIFLFSLLLSFAIIKDDIFMFPKKKYELEKLELEKGQKSWLTSFLERKISLPNRKISFSEINIHDALVSVISVPLITVADKEGIWLKINDVTIQWNPIAFLTGKLFFSTLKVERIDILRKPKHQKEAKNTLEEESNFLKFSLPLFSTMLRMNSISVKKIVVEDRFLDKEATFSLIGKATFTNRIFNSKLIFKRLDKKEGNLSLTAKYDQKQNNLDLNFDLNEPANGIINKILGIENSYPINFSLKGNGHIKNITFKLISKSGKPRMHGVLSIRNERERSFFLLSIEGLSRFIPERYHQFVGKKNSLTIKGTITKDLNIEIEKFIFNAPKNLIATRQETSISPLHLLASGSYKNTVLTVDNFIAKTADGFSVIFHGRIPFSGGGLDLVVRSIIPLSLINHFLKDANTRFTGQLVIDGHLGGNFSSLLPKGHFLVKEGKFFNSYVQLTEIFFSGQFDNKNLVFDQFTGKSEKNGTFSLYGSLTPNIQRGLPAQLTLRANQLQYSNSNETLFQAILDGNIKITGPLLYNPLFSGSVGIKKIEIDLSDKKEQTSLLDVQHINLSPMIGQTLKLVEKIGKKKSSDSIRLENKRFPFNPVFDLQINAPRRIFIRGKGVDAELGGSMRLNGKLSDIIPVGSFDMIRGQFDILGRKLSFSKGEITLTGNLNPELNFIAETNSKDLLVTLNIKGTPDALSINFNSKPELPQDEILSRLLFNRSLNELSAFQIALLLDAAAEITGITKKSLISNLRSSIGLDTLNVVTDLSGKMSIQIGRYIHDNIYIGVETGNVEYSRGTINFDVNQNFKVKANVDTNANSGIGFFFEKEY